jgi:hypothetical protein
VVPKHALAGHREHAALRVVRRLGESKHLLPRVQLLVQELDLATNAQLQRQLLFASVSIAARVDRPSASTSGRGAECAGPPTAAEVPQNSQKAAPSLSSAPHFAQVTTARIYSDNAQYPVPTCFSAGGTFTPSCCARDSTAIRHAVRNAPI